MTPPRLDAAEPAKGVRGRPSTVGQLGLQLHLVLIAAAHAAAEGRGIAVRVVRRVCGPRIAQPGASHGRLRPCGCRGDRICGGPKYRLANRQRRNRILHT